MKIKIVVPVFMFVASLLFITNCKKNTETRFLIKVDSVQMPDTIRFGDTLTIALFGTIGSNGCYSFDKIEPVFEDTTITVKVWGINSGADVCPEVMVYLDGMKLSFTNFQQGRYQVVFIQPDDGKLERSVVVI